METRWTVGCPQRYRNPGLGRLLPGAYEGQKSISPGYQECDIKSALSSRRRRPRLMVPIMRTEISRMPTELRRKRETVGCYDCLCGCVAGLRTNGSCKHCFFINHHDHHGLLDVFNNVRLRSRRPRFSRAWLGRFHSGSSRLECCVRLGSGNCMGLHFWKLLRRVWNGWIFCHRCAWRPSWACPHSGSSRTTRSASAKTARRISRSST